MEMAVVRAIQGRGDAFTVLHHADLAPRQRDVLLLEFFGLEIDEMANLLAVAKQTVKNHLYEARSKVVPPNLPPTRANATFWTGVHRECCMATAFAMLSVGAIGQKDEKTSPLGRCADWRASGTVGMPEDSGRWCVREGEGRWAIARSLRGD